MVVHHVFRSFLQFPSESIFETTSGLKVRLCRARVSSCSDELRKRRPFGVVRLRPKVNDTNKRPELQTYWDETFAKCVQCVQITVFLCTPLMGREERKCIQCIQFTVIFVTPYWRQRVRERIIMYNNILYNNIYNYI